MEHTYTDYLFILDLYNESITLDKLLFHMDGPAGAAPGARARAEQALEDMEKKGLVALTRRSDGPSVRLTAFGHKTANSLADVLADRLVNDWQARGPGYPKNGAAGF